MGGKEVADYAILRQDIRGWLFGIGYLGSLDMEWIWPQIVEIAKKNKIRAGGDTNCAGANTSMFWPVTTWTEMSPGPSPP